jgi:hypothetical protein
MMRYFFDVVDEGVAAFDYHGREFSSPEAAYSLAELLALDLQVRDAASNNCCVSVLDASGNHYFNIPVRPEREAAD